MHRLGFLVLSCGLACTKSATTPPPATLPSMSAEQLRVASVAFPEDPHRATSCTSLAARKYVECVLRDLLVADDAALALALRLYDELGIVVGVDLEKVTDDGSYRGLVHTVPAVPVGEERVHMHRVLDALHRIKDVIDALTRRANRQIAFVRAPAALRFFRTVDGVTPSAYATNNEIGYNLNGELWTTEESVEDTLVHELFHLGDETDDWSETALRPTFDRIRSECGMSEACLAPYAPFDTRVDGGVYYAFHPKSDVREYGGELAIRFFREQRQWMTGAAASSSETSFKCSRPENGVVWKAFAERFFGAVDLVPPCS